MGSGGSGVKARLKSPRSESKKPKLKKIKKSMEEVRVPEVPMYVSDNWLGKWISHSGDAKQEWNFGYQYVKNEFFLPVEYKCPMNLLQYDTVTRDWSPLPVLVIVNGHVLRIFKGLEYAPDQPLIITFNLREVSFTVSKERDPEKFFVISRFHGRVFILQAEDTKVVDSLLSCVIIDSIWSRKFSVLEYPPALSSSLWQEVPYQKRDAIVPPEVPVKEIGWVSYGGSSMYARFEVDDVVLGKNEEDGKVRAKICIENAQIYPANEKNKGRAISFNLSWGKKKEFKRESLQFNEIIALERWVCGNKIDQSRLSPYESRTLKMVSQFNTRTDNPRLVYQYHPQLYGTLKDLSTRAPSKVRAVEAKWRTTMRISGFSAEKAAAGEATPTAGPSPSTSEALKGLKEASWGGTDLGGFVETFAEMIEETGRFSNRLENVEFVQESLASVLEKVSTQVSTMDPKVQVLMEKESNFQEDMDNIETRISAIESKMNISNPTIPENTLDLNSLNERLKLIEEKFENQKILEQKVDALTDKLSKLSIVCQKLALQLKQQ
eukprot:TRINITY_DN16441_c0_g1_i1.p1 TRINITY_DN16441_c0_g1~~TRINITY_DN16441_c0_g1_i1.p1  ORF type:complete len:618 (-),score=143.64 TRINITY_DN16441_c0_g1_i1:43-1689(-)